MEKSSRPFKPSSSNRKILGNICFSEQIIYRKHSLRARPRRMHIFVILFYNQVSLTYLLRVFKHSLLFSPTGVNIIINQASLSGSRERIIQSNRLYIGHAVTLHITVTGLNFPKILPSQYSVSLTFSQRSPVNKADAVSDPFKRLSAECMFFYYFLPVYKGQQIGLPLTISES